MGSENTEITKDEKETIFVERYRPKKISDIVLPDYLKNNINEWIKKGLPNLLLVSKSPGLGKSSLCHVIISEMNAEALFINASLESNIDVLRNKIAGFVTTASFDGKPKIIVLDEADGLNQNSVQPALRAFIEEFSKNARFILTCNDEGKIIEPLQDRLMRINFDDIFHEHKELIIDIYKRCVQILDSEGIEYKPEDLKNVVKKYYPKSRKIIMKIQQNILGNVLDFHKETLDNDKNLEELINNILEKDFVKIRKNITLFNDVSSIYSYIYENIDIFPYEKHPAIVMILAKYQANDSLVRDKIINVAACLTELMTAIGG